MTSKRSSVNEDGGGVPAPSRPQEVYDNITRIAASILTSMDATVGQARAQQAAWRIATEYWLKSQGYITVEHGRTGSAPTAITKQLSVTRL